MGMGGARPGAGRKPKIDARKPASFTLPPNQLVAIEAIANRDTISRSEALSRLIARALVADDQLAVVADVVNPVEAIMPQASFPVAIGDVLRDSSGRRTRLVQVERIDGDVVFAVTVDVKRANPLQKQWTRWELIALLTGGAVSIEKTMSKIN